MQGNRFYLTNTVSKKLFDVEFKPQKIAFQIVKGGTGKTTAIHNVSCAASLLGAKVLAIDLDPQGNLTDSFAIDPECIPVLIDVVNEEAPIKEAVVNVAEGIDLIPSRIENVTLDSKLAIDKIPLHTLFQNLLAPIEQDYDFIFIDCPPMMGHSVTAASLFTDIIVVPLTPDKFSVKGLHILKKEISTLQRQYGKVGDYRVFLNKYNSNTILSDKLVHTVVNDEINLGKALTTAVRHTQEIPNVVEQNMNLFCTLKKSSAKEDFLFLTKELLDVNFR